MSRSVRHRGSRRFNLTSGKLHRGTKRMYPTGGNSLLNNLSSYWKLEEASGTRIDSVGTNNLTDNNNNLGNATGISGSGLSITAQASNAGLSVSDNPVLGIGAGVSFTISAWVKVTTLAINAPIFSKWGTTSNEYVLLANSNGGTITFSVVNLAGTQVNVAANFTPTIGTFFHVACGYDDSTQLVWIQVNGGSRYQVPCAGVRRTAQLVQVGNYGSGLLVTTFLGTIDEIGFWRRSLSSAEAILLNNGGSANPYPFYGSPGTDGYKVGTAVSSMTAAALVNYSAAPIVDTKIRALDAFYSGILADGLAAKMYAIFTFPALGDIGWAKAPLIYTGNTVNIGSTLTGANVTINGLVGNAAQYFTAASGTDLIASINDSGWTIYGYNLISQATQYDFGYTDNAGTNMFAAKLKEANTTKAFIADVNSSTSVATPANGYFSANRDSSTSLKVYFANSTTGHAQIGTTNTNANAGVLQAQPIVLAGVWAFQSGGIFAPSSNTYSFLAIHRSLTASESSKLFTRVQTLRTALGGGFV